MVQDEDIKTSDEGISAEIESIVSEINTADTQLNTSCSTKEPNTHHCLNPHALAESFDHLCSSSIISFQDRERQSVHANVHNGRTSAIVGSASVTDIRPLATEQHQGPGGPAEVEEQEWEVTKILDKRETRSGTEYRVRWKSTWLPRSELGNARRLLREYEAKGRAQHGPKRGRPTHNDKVW